MSVSAAELPAMAGATGDESARAAELRARLTAGLRQIAFFVVPSAVIFLALGDVVTAALYQTGEFTREMSVYVWAILAGAAVGLLPSTLGRLYASTYYALHDTRTPLRFALIRVGLSLLLGFLFAVRLPPLLGIELHWGAAGLTLASGLAAWVEYSLLRWRLQARIGATSIPGAYLAGVWTAAVMGAAAAWLARAVIPVQQPLIRAIFLLGTFGLVYLGVTTVWGLPEARRLTRRLWDRQSAE
jgi:putative peptidoglycan lipid II flippase